MIKSTSIRIRDLHCIDCCHKIEKSVSKTKGVFELHLSIATGQLNVTYDPKQISLPELEKHVEDLGYNVFQAEMSENSVVSVHNFKFIFTVFSGIFLFLGLLVTLITAEHRLMILGYNIYISQVFFIIAMGFGGYYILKHALGAFFKWHFAIESLMLIGAAGAVLIGAFAEAAAIVFLFSIAELLESYATARTRTSINNLLTLTPKTVVLKKGNQTSEVPVNHVRSGNVVVVRSGTYIGVDGIVLKGRSTVNQAPITGEAMPVAKEPGDTVFAGTLNLEGTLDVKATKCARDSTLAKIIKLVESSEENKSPTERFMDRFAKYYTPSILLLAVIVILVPTFIFHQPFELWFYKALMLILISCPCALAISTPVSIVSAITNGAKNGVLFKGGVHVENAARVDTFAFDKTGTLTTGKPVVTDIIPLKNHSKKELITLAASLECLSKHPLGDALVEYAKREGVHQECVEKFRTIPGKGVYGKINGKLYYVGGKSLFKKSALKGLDNYFTSFTDEAKTVVVIGTTEEAIGLVAFADDIRVSGKKMVKDLKKAGVNQIVMLTGDIVKTAEIIADSLGIDEYHAELLPHEKVTIIKKLRAKNGNGKVAMVGDGINDSPALAVADLGIAMGAAGSDSALETADVALMKDDLSKVPYMLRLSRKTMSVVKQNIVLAIGVKLLFAILVFPGLVTLWMAVAIGDMGISLGVILNALRLGR